jgi:hypothetical protein
MLAFSIPLLIMYIGRGLFLLGGQVVIMVISCVLLSMLKVGIGLKIQHVDADVKINRRMQFGLLTILCWTLAAAILLASGRFYFPYFGSFLGALYVAGSSSFITLVTMGIITAPNISGRQVVFALVSLPIYLLFSIVVVNLLGLGFSTAISTAIVFANLGGMGAAFCSAISMRMLNYHLVGSR